MDRIVIIGNGFDKAHNLKTGYSDFMDYLLDSIAKYDKVEGILKENIKGKSVNDNYGYYHRVDKNGENDKWICAKQDIPRPKFTLVSNPKVSSIYFKSLFLENRKLGYWSDL